MKNSDLALVCRREVFVYIRTCISKYYSLLSMKELDDPARRTLSFCHYIEIDAPNIFLTKSQKFISC
jgi:hypothetical protein